MNIILILKKMSTHYKTILSLNPFVTYQDMIDGAFYDDFVHEHDEETEEDKEEDTEPQEREKEGDTKIQESDAEPESRIRQIEEDSLSELSADDTIHLIQEVFNYCKRLRRSQKRLKQTVQELKQTIAYLNDRVEKLIPESINL
jgi:hypothetical protein